MPCALRAAFNPAVFTCWAASVTRQCGCASRARRSWRGGISSKKASRSQVDGHRSLVARVGLPLCTLPRVLLGIIPCSRRARNHGGGCEAAGRGSVGTGGQVMSKFSVGEVAVVSFSIHPEYPIG